MHRTRFCGERDGRRPPSGGRAAQGDGRSHAQEVLREVAYVLHLARSVKQAMTAEAGVRPRPS
jgi:hypothetical protein